MWLSRHFIIIIIIIIIIIFFFVYRCLNHLRCSPERGAHRVGQLFGGLGRAARGLACGQRSLARHSQVHRIRKQVRLVAKGPGLFFFFFFFCQLSLHFFLLKPSNVGDARK
jgi:hypothetical protein